MRAVTSSAAIEAYASAVRRLLDRGGFERSGNVAEARSWGLDHIARFLDAAGRPDARRTVHIAGSKGKGSTATMVEAILRAAGAHTLLLTSPDLHAARERIAIEGEPIAHDAFAALAQRLLDDPATAGWSYFELLTVLGWLAGAQAACDWQVLEVGLGGRLDTTNAVREKAVAVVTAIDLEHTAILGETIAAIAAEKAAIIASGCAAVAAPMREPALDVVRDRCRSQGVELHVVAEQCAMRPVAQSLDEQRFDLRTPLRTYRGLRLALVGPHQRENAATAVRAAELALEAAGEPLAERAVVEGLRSVRLAGRFEVLRRRPLLIVDGLHTPLAARRFRETVEAVGLPRQRVLVIGLLAGKELDGVASELVRVADTVVVAPPHTPRAADTAAVARAFLDAGVQPQRAPDIAAALGIATTLAGDRGAVAVVGSLYSVAEAREVILPISGDRALGLR